MHRRISKWQYKRKALTRHGVHSPFVFDFVEQLLNSGFRNNGVMLSLPFSFPGIKFDALAANMAAYYDCRTAEVWNAAVQQLSGNGSKGFDRLLLSTPEILPERLPVLSGTILVVSAIRVNNTSEERWKQIYEQAAVSLSVDLFDIGVLFFEKDFRIKQHFMLRF